MQPDERKRIQLLEPAEEIQPIERQRRRKKSPPSWQKRLRRWTRIRWLNAIVSIVAILIVLVVGAVAIYVDSTNRIGATTASLMRVIENLSEKSGTELTVDDYQRLRVSVDELNETLLSAGRRLQYFQLISGFNPELQMTLLQIDIGQDLTQAAHAMLVGFEPALLQLASPGGDASEAQSSPGERLFELLRGGREQFIAAQQYLDTAANDLNTLDVTALPEGYAPNVDLLVEYQRQLVQINAMLIQSPDLLATALGLAGEQRYLMLIQSGERLRPAGGYPIIYGWVIVRNGRISDFAFEGTAPTVGQNGTPEWWQNALGAELNPWTDYWQADFPSVAGAMLTAYNSGANAQTPINAVIALDLSVLPHILATTDAVIVPGYNNLVGAENFRQEIYSANANGGDRRFLAALVETVLTKWQEISADPAANLRLNGIILEALQQKQIMFYFDDAALDEAMTLLGWSGRQSPAVDHDYLMVTDTNLGNFSNGSIIRQITYDVDIQPDHSFASRVTIAYDYSASTAASDPAVNEAIYGLLDYRNLLQVFAPVGAEISSTDNLPDTVTVLAGDNHTQFIAALTVPYDSVERYQLSYENRTGIISTVENSRHYRLLVQKQPGAVSNIINIQITLPPGAQAFSYAPEPVAAYMLDGRQILEYRLTLDVDHWIDIMYGS